MYVDITGAARVARLSAEFDWTWYIEDFPRFCLAAGWELIVSGELGAEVLTDLQVERPECIAFYRKRILKYFSCFVTDVSAAGLSRAGSRKRAVDGFVDLGQVLGGYLGEPNRYGPGSDFSVGWDRPNVAIAIQATSDSIFLSVASPEYQAFLDEPEPELDV